MPEAKRQHPEVSIIIPTYNERENLPLLVQRMGELADEFAKKFKTLVGNFTRNATFAELEKVLETQK